MSRQITRATLLNENCWVQSGGRAAAYLVVCCSLLLIGRTLRVGGSWISSDQVPRAVTMATSVKKVK